MSSNTMDGVSIMDQNDRLLLACPKPSALTASFFLSSLIVCLHSSASSISALGAAHVMRMTEIADQHMFNVS
jgi:hypothetical protein